MQWDLTISKATDRVWRTAQLGLFSIYLGISELKIREKISGIQSVYECNWYANLKILP